MKTTIVTALGLALFFSVCSAGEKPELKDENDKVNYSYGYQVADGLKRQGVKVNPEVIMQGIRDALSGTEPLMTPEEMSTIVKELPKKARAAKNVERKNKEEKNRRESREFLVANGKKSGVVTLPSGLQYKVIREGTGKTPGPHDSVTVNYRGTLINGNEFDSSYRRGKPATFRVDGVIAGWTEALQLMKEGAKWQLFIPPDLAYGERGTLADKTLIFDVELISVN